MAPSTTATALTSITTGLPPGQHGVVGYRMAVDGEVLNVLRWNTATGDARQSIPPSKIQTQPCFGGQRPPVVTRAEFASSGFTAAHLDQTRFTGYRTLGTLVAEVVRLASAGEPLVYAYYEGLDKVSHEYGLGAPYDEELRWIDHLVASLLDALPPGTVLLVTADHGQVEVGDHVLELPGDVLTHVALQSGEGRFRWLHARSGRAPAAARGGHRASSGSTRGSAAGAEALAEGWFGPIVTEAAERRLGDVLLAARGDVAFHDPDDTGPYQLVGRHGSLTEDEMLVPAARRGGRLTGAGSVAAMSDPDPPRSRAGPRPPSVVAEDEDEPQESVESPGKVMRIGSMIKQLLEEVRGGDLDEPSRERLREIYETSVTELSAALSPDLRDELARLTHPFEGAEPPSDAELRVAKAQLVGWLEGLFHGIQATLFAQQMAARQQLEQMQRQLPPAAPAQVRGPVRTAGPAPTSEVSLASGR